MHAFIVDGACRVERPEQLGHLENDLAAKGLVAAGPDQDRRVVFVPLDQRVDAIEQQVLPFEMVTRQDRLNPFAREPAHVPGTVGLHVRFIDHIEAIFVAEMVEARIIGVMAGPDRIDVVALHGQDVVQQLGF